MKLQQHFYKSCVVKYIVYSNIELHSNKPAGLTQVKMVISSTIMSSVNVSVTVSPYIPGGGLTTGMSDVSCQSNKRYNHN